MLDNDRLMECKPVSPTPNAVAEFQQSIASTGCGLGLKKIDGRRNYHEQNMKWFGPHYTSCMNVTSGTTVFLNSGSAPTGSSVMRLTVRNKFFVGKNLRE
jgi:hypothetical protein